MARSIRSIRLLLVLTLAAAALAAAHRADAAPPRPARAAADTVRGAVAVDSLAEYTGWYRWGFEHSEFIACAADARDRPWWVVPTDVALRQRDSLAVTVTPGAAGPVFVRVRGVAGQRLGMGAGHLGGGTRYFRLLEVLDMRKADGATCPVST